MRPLGNRTMAMFIALRNVFTRGWLERVAPPTFSCASEWQVSDYRCLLHAVHTLAGELVQVTRVVCEHRTR